MLLETEDGGKLLARLATAFWAGKERNTPEDGFSLSCPQLDIFDDEIRISVQVHCERICTRPCNYQSELPFLVWVGENGSRFAVTPTGADGGVLNIAVHRMDADTSLPHRVGRRP